MRSRDLGECFKVKRIVLDTSVLIEYILSGSPCRPKVVSLLNRAVSVDLKTFH